MNSADKLSKQIDELWLKHLPLMQSRLETIRVAAEALQQGQLSQEIRASARDAAHKLAGSLGTFSLESASRDAVEIEQLLGEDVISGYNPALLEQHLTRIRQAIDKRG